MPELSTSAILKAAGLLSRFQPWALVKRNNRLASQEYVDLYTWVRDDLIKEQTALKTWNADLARRDMIRSGAAGQHASEVREEFSRRWRDRRRGSERLLAELRESEGLTAALWRKLTGAHWPKNPWQHEIEESTTAWEAESW